MTFVGYGKKDVTPPYKVTGVVYDVGTGASVPDASIYILRQEMGTTSSEEGDYSFELYPGVYDLQVSAIGFKTSTKKINVYGPGSVNFPLFEQITELDEVVLELNQETPVTNNELGTERLNVSSIKTLPRIGGELNILNSLTLLPGVSTQGEASGGLNIRGGASDQNLILLGGATLYNPFHLFGFFSGFNSSVVRDVTLHKGVVPANFGGRASGIVDIAYKKGNFQSWESTINLGSTASKFSSAGPVIKDKLSATIAGRVAYPSWLLRYTQDPSVANSTASFYDHNLILDYAINEKSNLEYSHYFSGDSFQFPEILRNEWYNRAFVLRYASDITDRLFFDAIATRSDYSSQVIDRTPFASFEIERAIGHSDISTNLHYKFSDNNILRVGGMYKSRDNNPGERTPLANSIVSAEVTEEEQAIESGIYFQHEISFFEKISLNYGTRLSLYSFRGPQTVNTYATDAPRNVGTITGSERIESGSIKNYKGWEPRFGISFVASKSLSIKAGYSRQYQYIHQLTNTSSIAPTDQWKLSDTFIKPQISTQYSLGLFKSFRGDRIQTSIQGFYRDFENLLEFKDGADIALNQDIEAELINATGKAYGVELLVEKSKGKNFGWISYTYSRSLRRTTGQFAEEQINSGAEYPCLLYTSPSPRD